MNLFGLDITTKKQKKKEDEAKSFVPKVDVGEAGEDSYIQASGIYGQYIDLTGNAAKTAEELIKVYRAIARHSEVDAAIQDIVSEAISAGEKGRPVELDLDDMEGSDKLKEKIKEEFDHICNLLNFSWTASDLFRRWYEDGRIYFHKIPHKNEKQGLLEIRYVDATKMRKVKEVIKNKNAATGADEVVKVEEYFVYKKGTSESKNGSLEEQGIKVNPDAITYVSSGLVDENNKFTISHLHKAIKPANNLAMVENAQVIYRLARAPERRVFYVDVGNLPKGKAEEYLQKLMAQYRNKLNYNTVTGKVEVDSKQMSMLEDFWLPRREGSRGTEISTLPGGTNLGQIDDIEYFQKKLYKALNVPMSRLMSEENAMVSIGRGSEITRDELKYQKFINKLRKKFSLVLIDCLMTQLILKNIVTQEEWEDIKQDISIDFIKDSFITELKEAEILRERINLLREIDEYVGVYYSREWVRKNVLQQTEDDIKEIDKEIKKNKDKPAGLEFGMEPQGGGNRFESVEDNDDDIINE